MPISRAPTSLQAQAEEQANTDHRRRLAELQAMGPLFAKLDAFVPALAAQGLTIYPNSCRLSHLHTGGRRTKVLRLRNGSLFDDRVPGRWLAALAGLGFVEVSRTKGPYPVALLRHGHLLLEVDAPVALADTVAVAATAQRHADRAVAAAAAQAAA